MVEWLIINNLHTPPDKEFFPKPARRPDGSYIYERIPSVGGDGPNSSRQQMLYKKRPYEDKPVEHALPNKVGKPTKGRGYSVNQVTPKGASESRWLDDLTVIIDFVLFREDCHHDQNGGRAENCHQLAGRSR